MSHLLHVLVDTIPYCHLGRPCVASGACGMALSADRTFVQDLRGRLGDGFSVEVAAGPCPVSGSGLAPELECEEVAEAS